MVRRGAGLGWGRAGPPLPGELAGLGGGGGGRQPQQRGCAARWLSAPTNSSPLCAGDPGRQLGSGLCFGSQNRRMVCF